MNHDFQDIEEALAKLKPAPVPDRLVSSIAEDLDQPARTPQIRHASAFWQSNGIYIAGFAALFLVGFVLYKLPSWTGVDQSGPALTSSLEPDQSGVQGDDYPSPSAHEAVADTQLASGGTTETDRQAPVRARNYLHNRVDDGLVFLNGGVTARQYRYQFVDRVVWEDPSDGSKIEMSVPREEIVLVPVHTF